MSEISHEAVCRALTTFASGRRSRWVFAFISLGTNVAVRADVLKQTMYSGSSCPDDEDGCISSSKVNITCLRRGSRKIPTLVALDSTHGWMPHCRDGSKKVLQEGLAKMSVENNLLSAFLPLVRLCTEIVEPSRLQCND